MDDKYPWGPIQITISQGTFNCIALVVLIYLGLVSLVEIYR